MRLRPAAAAARRFTHLALTDMQGGEAAAYVLRKKLGSCDRDIRQHAIEVMCAVMKLCPWFYRFCAGEKFWNELWRSGSKKKRHSGTGNEDDMLANDRKQVARIVEGWTESLKRGAEQDPAARFWIEKYEKKVLGGGWIIEGDSVNTWVCWVSDSGILAGGHPRLYGPQYSNKLMIFDANAKEQRRRLREDEDLLHTEDDDSLEDVGTSKILAAVKKRKQKVICDPEFVMMECEREDQRRQSKEEQRAERASSLPLQKRTAQQQKSRVDKQKKPKKKRRRRRVDEAKRFDEAVERARALEVYADRRRSSSIALETKPSPAAHSIAAAAREKTRERLKKASQAVDVPGQGRALDASYAESAESGETGLAHKVSENFRNKLRARASIESAQTSSSEPDDISLSVGSSGAITPCTYNYIPILGGHKPGSQPSNAQPQRKGNGRKRRPSPNENNGVFGDVQGGVGPIFRLLTDESHTPTDVLRNEEQILTVASEVFQN